MMPEIAAALTARDHAIIDNWGWFWFIVVVTLLVCVLFGFIFFGLLSGGGIEIVLLIFTEIVLFIAIPALTVRAIEKAQDIGGSLHRPHIHVGGWGIVWLLVALLIGEAIALAVLRAPQAIPVTWGGTVGLIGGGWLVVFVFRKVTEHAGLGSVLGIFAAIGVGMLLVFALAFVARAVAR